ncbi:hypothetical protein D3C71_574420 [compost metagenome]
MQDDDDGDDQRRQHHQHANRLGCRLGHSRSKDRSDKHEGVTDKRDGARSPKVPVSSGRIGDRHKSKCREAWLQHKPHRNLEHLHHQEGIEEKGLVDVHSTGRATDDLQRNHVAGAPGQRDRHDVRGRGDDGENGSDRPMAAGGPSIQRPLKDMSQHPQHKEGSKKAGPNEDHVEDQGLDRTIVDRARASENDSERCDTAPDRLTASDDLFCRRSGLFGNLTRNRGILSHRVLNLLRRRFVF